MINSTPETSVQIERAGAVAWVWLNRPAVRNAFNQAVIGELSHAFAALGADPAVRVIVLGGRGASFCAGGDLNWIKASASYSDEDNRADAAKLAQMLRGVRTCPKPVIARVQGDAFGGGFGLVCVADIAIGASTSRFALSEVRLGLVPATIAPYVLATIGPRAASRYMLTAERLNAEEAQRLGLLHSVVPEQDLDTAVQSMIDHLLGGSPAAISATKELILDVAGKAVDDALIAQTVSRIAVARASAQGREGIDAFLNKRKPSWAP